MKTYTADEWIEGATLECGVYWREADGSDVEVQVRDGAMYATYGLRGGAAGTITVSGDGGGGARRSGSGAGDAVRRGSGAGGACRCGSGVGSAYRDGDGDGNAVRRGSGVGNAYRTGNGIARATKPHEKTWQSTPQSVRDVVFYDLLRIMRMTHAATAECADMGLHEMAQRQQMLADAYSAAIDILRDAERAPEDHNP